MKTKGLLIALSCLLLCGLLLCAPALAEGDFTIDSNGCLMAYTGTAARVEVPEGVTSIGEGVFKNNTTMSVVKLPEGITMIGNEAFNGCTELTTVTLPDSLTRVGKSVFKGCTSLTSIYAGENITRMDSTLNFISGSTYAKVYVSRKSATAVTMGWTEYTDPDYPLLKLADTKVDADGNYTVAVVKCTNTSVTSITLPPETVRVNTSAFAKCRSLKQITIPEGVTLIDTGAFSNCAALKTVTLPKSLEYIGDTAFAYCDALTQVIIPDGVTHIGEAAFRECNALTELILPKGITAIPDSMCYKCIKLEKIAIPENVRTVGEYVFYDCEKLTEAVFSGPVESIGQYTFYDCDALTEVVLPEGLTTLSDYLFYNCDALRIVELPDGLTTICGSVFNWCQKLERVNLPETITSLDTGAFGTSGHTAIITSYTSPWALKLGMARVPVVDPRYPDVRVLVTGTAEEPVYTLAGAPVGATDVVVPDFLTSMQQYAFNYHPTVRSVTLPEGITQIRRTDFAGCTALETVVLPDSVTVIEEYAFVDCTALKTVRLPANLKTLGNSAFINCISLSSPLTVTAEEIDRNAFFNCRALTSVSLPNITTLPDNAFSQCVALEELNLPEGLTTIGQMALGYCSSLKRLVLPSTVTTIANNAMVYCGALEELVLPAGLTTIGQNAFSGCNALSTLVLPESLTAIDQVVGSGFAEGQGIRTVVLHRGITSLAEAAFGPNLTTVYCYRNTYADTWAQSNAETIIYLDEEGATYATLTGPEGTFLYQTGETVDIADQLSLTPVVNGQEYHFTCVSSDPAVVSAAGTVLEMLSPGEAEITVTVQELPGVSCSFRVVVGHPVEDFSLPDTLLFNVSEDGALLLTPKGVAPEGALSRFHWVADIGGSVVESLTSDGDTFCVEDPASLVENGCTLMTVTAAAPSGVYRTCRVYLYSSRTGIQLTVQPELLAGWRVETETAVLLNGTPVTAFPEMYTLASSNPDVVRVTEAEQLEALMPGTAEVTAATTDGLHTHTVTVTVHTPQTMPADLTEIGEEAFAGCGFTALKVPEGCGSIGARAFADCRMLKIVVIPASVAEIAEDAFAGSAPLICAPEGSAAAVFAAEHWLPVYIVGE